MDKLEKIVVVDLDNTLLFIDSFNLFLAVQSEKNFLKIGLLRILRKIRILSSAKFKELVSNYVYNFLSEEEKLSFIHSLGSHINRELFNSINDKYRNDCRILIISASFNQYVKPFAENLGWQGFGSYRDSSTGRFMHLHGDGKINFLEKFFPPETFTYKYAISDSLSDLSLLKKFEKYDLIKPKFPIP